MSLQPFISVATESTPHILFDPGQSIFEMKGESRPENAKAFYDPLIDWIRIYCDWSLGHIEHPGNEAQLILNVHFDYFSSASAKYLMNIFARMEELYRGGRKIEIHWVYNEIDIEMKESGEEFQKLLSIPFVFEVIKN
jgi:hypothetical protein